MNNVISLPIDGMRPAPSNIEAERALLGTLLLRNSSLDAVTDFLKPEHFCDPANGMVYAAISELIANGKKAEPPALKIVAEATGPIQAAGGMKYIAGLCASAPTHINAAEYGALIQDTFLRRELIALTTQATVEAYEDEDRALSQIESMEERLFALTANNETSNISDLGSATGDAIERAEIAYRANGELIGVTTGLTDLNYKLGGLHKSDLTILAGRPSMGKSGLAMSIAFNAAKAGKTVAFFSLEMSASQLATRALSHQTGIDSHRLRNGRIGAADFQRLHTAKTENAALPLYIEDRSAPTVPQIRTACRRLKRKHGLDLVIVDYLQLITPTRAGSQENRVNEVSGISRGLKAIARDLNVPVLALSQLSRQVEQREDKRPQLSDLRESGSIEQDADVVMFVYRDEYYLTRNGGICPPDLENVAEVNISKQRHGPIGRVRCHFDQKSAWFGNLAGEVSGR